MSAAQGKRIILDLDGRTARISGKDDLYQGDSYANDIVVELTRGGQPAQVSGYTASGEFERSDGVKVPCEGAMSGNVATIKLDEHCYYRAGAFRLTVRLSKSNEEVTRTVLEITGTVQMRSDGPTVDVNETLINVDKVLELYEEMKDATKNVQSATDEANAAAQAARQATTNANSAAGNAEVASGAVNSSIAQASAATANANTAASNAINAARNAELQANSAGDAALRALTAAAKPPIVDMVTKKWRIWDDASQSYKDTSYPAQGPEGPAGAKGSDASVTKANIVSALGYTPANKDDITVSAEKISEALGYTPAREARVNEVDDSVTTVWNRTVHNFGHTPDRYLGTDSEGNVVTKTAPTGGDAGSGLPGGAAPFNQLVTDINGNAEWRKLTHWTEGGRQTVLEKSILTDIPSLGKLYGMDFFQMVPIVGDTYIVRWGETEYEVLAGSFGANDANVYLPISNPTASRPFQFIFYGSGTYAGNVQINTENPVDQIVAEIYRDLPEIVHKIDKKYLPDDIGGMPSGGEPDKMLVTDEDGNTKWADRSGGTGWTAEKEAVLLDMTLELEEGMVNLVEPLGFVLELGKTYNVLWNGELYESTAVTFPSPEMPAVAIGNVGLLLGEEGTGEPFAFVATSEEFGEASGMYAGVMAFDGSETATIKIEGTITTVHKIDEKYMPDTDYVVYLKIDEELTAAAGSGSDIYAAYGDPEMTKMLTYAETRKRLVSGGAVCRIVYDEYFKIERIETFDDQREAKAFNWGRQNDFTNISALYCADSVMGFLS